MPRRPVRIFKQIWHFYQLKSPGFVFLGAFAILREASISFVTSVRLPARKIGSHWKDFREIWYLNIFRKSVKKIQFSLKYGKSNGEQYTFLIISQSVLVRMRNVSDKNCRKKSKNTFYVRKRFSKILSFMRQSGKILYSRAGHILKKGGIRIAFSDTQGYKHTLKICNTSCLSTATIVARTRLYVT